MTAATASSPVVAPRVQRVPWPAKYLALSVIWGSSFLLMKVGLHAMAPVQIACLRIVTGASVILGLLHLTGGRLPTGRRTWAHLLVSGLFLSALPFVLFAWGETRVPSALAGIGNATTPLATVVCTFLFLPSARVGSSRLVAVLVGFLGVVVIMQPWTADRPDLVGFAATLAGGACYGVGWTYNRRFLAGVDFGGLSQPAATLLVGAILMVPTTLGWWLLSRSTHPTPWTLVHDGSGTATWLAVGAVLVLGVVGTGLAYMLQFDVVRAAGPTVASTITYLIPVVSVVLGAALLSEHLTGWEYAGAAIVLSAAVVVSRPTRGAR